MKKDGLDEKTGAKGGWTGVENYLVALARRRTARHKREGRPHARMDEDGPTPTLGTIPFIIIMVAFAVLVVAIASLAWPRHEEVKPKKPQGEVGYAPPGWFESAEKEMHRDG